MKKWITLQASLLMFSTLIFTTTVSAQTYCEYLFGFAWCSPGWEIDDITIGAFSESNSGCNNSAPYFNNTTSTIYLNKGSGTPFSLSSGGTAVQWGIWVDCNADGDFTDATDYFWATTTISSIVSGNLMVPAPVWSLKKPLSKSNSAAMTTLNPSVASVASSC